MKIAQSSPKTIDEYIAGFPSEVQTILKKIRATIRKAAPAAEEKISYQIPIFMLNGKYLIYFAAWKKHVAVYPAPRGHEKFKDELAAYEGGKGTIKFPLDRPIPFGLIGRIVKFKVKENLANAKAKKR
jgi:uncharacterized protein YdhG (YjbR/CyaY superfamily)